MSSPVFIENIFKELGSGLDIVQLTDGSRLRLNHFSGHVEIEDPYFGYENKEFEWRTIGKVSDYAMFNNLIMAAEALQIYIRFNYFSTATAGFIDFGKEERARLAECLDTGRRTKVLTQIEK